MECSIDGCGRLAARQGLCWGHVKRKMRKLPVQVELAPAKQSGRAKGDILLSAAIDLAELKPTDDAGWEKARDKLRKAAVRYAASLPKFQPLSYYLEKVAAEGKPWARERAA